jgi:RNA polymerase sigma factor (sigma-70 family)
MVIVVFYVYLANSH